MFLYSEAYIFASFSHESQLMYVHTSTNDPKSLAFRLTRRILLNYLFLYLICIYMYTDVCIYIYIYNHLNYII